MDTDEITNALAMLGAAGWEGDDSTLTCPHGSVMEYDCDGAPCGCKSPLIEAGLI